MRIRKIGAMNHQKAIKAGWTTKRRSRVNYAWWSKWSNVMKVRANYLRKQKVVAQRNIDTVKQAGGFDARRIHFCCAKAVRRHVAA